MNETLKKSEILKNKKEISNLFENGEWKRGRYVNVVSLPAEERRVLFTVARHIHGAVRRNRGKRYLRESYRLQKNYFSPNRIYGLVLRQFPETKTLHMIKADILPQLHHD